MRQHYGVICRLVLILYLFVLLSSSAFAASGLDLNHWTEERIMLSNLELVFQVPGGQHDAAPPRPTIRSVDLDSDFAKLPPERNGFYIYDHTWAVDSRFLKGNMGSLNLTVTVARRPNDYPAEFTSVDNLQPVIARSLDRTFAATNEKLRKQGQEKFTTRMPDTYNHVIINGREWLIYSLGGWFDRTFYATLLTKNHYLQFMFDFINNSRGYESNWRQQSQEVADKIMGSIEIREIK
jgi:hypothetical protein